MDIRQKALSAYQRAMGNRGGTEGSPPQDTAARGQEGSIPPGLLRTTGSTESRVSRVARFLVLLGREEAAKVLSHLPEAEVERIAEEIARTDTVDSQESRRILAEFGYRSRGETSGATGGRQRAREILEGAFGTERAAEILKRAAPTPPQELFGFLRDLEPHQVEHLLRKESVHVRSMVIAQLPPALAAGVLGRLDDEEKRAISLRIARMKELSPEVTERVAELLKERIRRDGVPVTEELDGTERLAEILRHMEPVMESTLLETLREGNQDIAEEVEQRLYRIDIIHDLRDDQLQKVLRRVDDQEIALLLKGKTELFRSKMLRNLSDRRQRLVVDEYHNLGPVRRKDAEQANRDFVELLKRLADEGEIVASWRGEEYT
ncbi:MAG: flagellar motor switch protein FliG [Alkalispirochaetaceae bacterium]